MAILSHFDTGRWYGDSYMKISEGETNIRVFD